MNVVLESFIDRIIKGEFNQTEIVIISETDTFSNDDLQKLEAAINANEWVKENLRVIQLLPNSITRAFNVDSNHGINWISISTKAELHDAIKKINHGEFHYSSISFGDGNSNGSKELDYDDLQKLSAAMSESHWCQKYPTSITISHHITCARITSETELADILHKLNSDSFHYSEIHLGGKFNDENLKELIAAINASDWCQEHLERIFIADGQISKLPAIKCKNLLSLRMFSTSIMDTEDLDCPNLEHVVAHNVESFNLQAVKSCTNIEQIEIFGSSIRVPPNIMGYAKLKRLNILDISTISSLGMYALLLMKINKKTLVIDSRMDIDFAKKFVSVYSHDKDFRIPADFHQRALYYYGIPEVYSNTDLDSFIDEFAIPQHFLEDQVMAIMSLMKKIYCSNDTCLKGKFKSLNDEYCTAKGLLHATIDGLLERHDQIGDIEPNNIMAAAEEKIGPLLSNLEEHTSFFLSELYSDFKILKEIFNAVGKPQHVDAINVYIAENNGSWPNKLDVKQELFETGKSHLEALRAKKLSKQMEIEEAEFLMVKAHEVEPEKSNYSPSCVIS